MKTQQHPIGEDVRDDMSATVPNRDELRFFGQVNASISHEMKNVLAVINEGAGLLDDLCLLSAKGRPVDPEKLGLVARSILGQVKRGDNIVRRMNSFAHSVDQDVHSFSLLETMQLMAGIGERVAASKGLKLDVEECDEVTIEADLYAVEHLLFAMLRFAVDTTDGGGSRLRFALSNGDDGVLLALRGVYLPEGMKPAEELTRLAEGVGARMDHDAAEGSLNVWIPAHMVRG
ncbi:MAG: hypothetical protein ACNI3A_19135 [Desulfovibrio sp.]|uniref:hypothetical protein n=1 Tax=Desulfovibrio sp. 7SRBS1 TaxID=3378064 RepID=UPI003B3F297E